MPDKVIIGKVTCGNPECGKELQLKDPPKSGLRKLTCPYCKHSQIVDFTSREKQGAKSAEDTVLQKPDNSGADPIVLKNDFIVNEPYTVTCPHCGVQKLPLKATAPGHLGVSCPLCKGRIELDVRAKTKPIVITDTESVDFTRGKLVLLRRGWFSNKEFPLKPGRKYTIGRHDEYEDSDISIKNDDSVSRRSVRIDVEPGQRGYTYKMSVLKATNPVVHNGMALMPGESIALNFGDTIVLGKTKFRFEKEKD